MPTIPGQALPLGVQVCPPWEAIPDIWSYRNRQNGWEVSDEYLANSELFVSERPVVHFAVLNPIVPLNRTPTSVSYDLFPAGEPMVTAIDSPAIWRHWNEATGNSNVTYYHLNIGEIFSNWYRNTTTATNYNVGTVTNFSVNFQPRQLTPEEIAEQERRIEQARRDAEERRQREAEELAAVNASIAKAKALLMEHLSKKQQEQYERTQQFEVLLPNGHRYRVKRGHAGNIVRFDENGFGVESFCIHAPHEIPAEDNMLAQKLLLEHDEEEFRRIANITPMRRAS